MTQKPNIQNTSAPETLETWNILKLENPLPNSLGPRNGKPGSMMLVMLAISNTKDIAKVWLLHKLPFEQ